MEQQQQNIEQEEAEPLIFERTKVLFKNQINYWIFPCIIALLIGFISGFLSGYLPLQNDKNLLKYYKSTINDIDYDYFEKLQNEIKAENIRNNLKEMTSGAHLAGTADDYKSALYIYNKWSIEQKLDYVKIIDYNVLLSYPDANQPNNIQFLNETNHLIESIDIIEPIIDHEINYTGIPNPFLAYAVNGSVTSDEIYYVNYCTQSDFLFFVKLKIDFKNKPVICRYGFGFRGDKVNIAQKYGASAVLLYDDPLRSAPNSDEIYPRGEFLPELGTQRGTLWIGSGDPDTPLYPSLDSAFRLNESLINDLPKIPAQVIGYKYALKIFQLLQSKLSM